MPEKCLYCGEVAVIEESLDGGGDQHICIECGSIAIATGIKVEPAIEVESTRQGGASGQRQTVKRESSIDQESLQICHSCGVRLDPGNASTPLCQECAELSDEENDNADYKSYHHPGPTAAGENCATSASAIGNENDTKAKCSSCGSKNLSLDSVGGDDRLVCFDCGMVNSETILTHDTFNNEGLSSSKYYRRTLPQFAEKERICKGMTVGLSKIACLCSKFCFSSTLQTEAEDMYQKLFFHPQILHKTLVKKESFAAVCLFIVCRQYEIPITLKHFISEVSKFRHFLSARKLVLKVLGIQLPHVSMTNLMFDILPPDKFDQSLMNKVKDILFLFRRAWLTQGRVRVGLVTLAAYYAYISSDKCKKYITRNQFCTKNKFPKLPQDFASECDKFLLKLAGSLPWAKATKITTKTLPLYISNILQYQDSLLHLVFKPEGNDDTSSPQLPGSVLSNSKNITNGSPMRKRQYSQKEILLPAASKKTKLNDSPYIEPTVLIPKGINLDSPELQENEFEDEINSYILTCEEQEKMKNDKLSIFRKGNQ